MPHRSARLIWPLVCAALAVLALVVEPRPQLRPPSLRLAFLGDVMLGRGVAQAHQEGGWDSALAWLAPDLRAADFSMANLESPITARPLVKPAYDIRAPASSTLALSAAGLWVLTLANNHSLDSGPAGAQDTRQALAASRLAAVGPEPVVGWFNVNGYTLAVLALDDISSPVDSASAAGLIESAARRANLVIVSVHWGMEYDPGPTPRQLALAREWVNAGAGLIIGQHPHVLQRVDWLPRPGRSDQALVAYSLGNALFDQPAPPDSNRGALLLVDWGVQGIQSVHALPFHIDPFKGHVGPASPEEAALIQQRLAR